MGTEASANGEWLELKNNTDVEIDLTNWRLEAEDGSPKISLVGTIEPNGFFILERTSDDTLPSITASQIYTGALGNTGEWLKLYDNENNLIDQINAAETWPAGDNLTKQTLERITTDSWQTSLNPGGTPLAENSTGIVPEEPNPETSSTSTPETIDSQTPGGGSLAAPAAPKKGSLIFNETLIDPMGVDSNDEFIEIRNTTEATVNLSGWKITNSAKQSFDLPPANLGPQTITFFYRSESKLALNNQKEELTLYADKQVIDKLKITAPATGQSYSRADGARWEWTDHLSPGQENPLPKNKDLPVATAYGPKTGPVGEILNFDASDSFSPNNEPMDYLWLFSDGRTDTRLAPKIVYLAAGKYEVTLVVSNQIASSTDVLKFTIIDNQKTEAEAAKNATTTNPTPEAAGQILGLEMTVPNVFISEFLPDPVGEENQDEFIEIFNQDGQTVNLAGWQIDDASGGSKPYLMPEGTIIKPGQYLTFNRAVTKIALNNSNDAVQLINPQGEIVDYAEYEETDEGKSFVLDQDFSWQQSNTITPGEINVLDNNQKPTTAANKISLDKNLPQLALETEPLTDKPDKSNRYIIAGLLTAVVLGLIIFNKIKKTNILQNKNERL